MMNIEKFLAEDIRLKRQARGGIFIGKKSPHTLLMPSDLRGRDPPYWKIARPIVKVDIVTGEILIFRWPVE